MLPRLALCVLSVSLTIGCGEGSDLTGDAGVKPPADCSSASAFQHAASVAGTYDVSACTAATPGPGQNAFTLLVTNASTGAPASGLSLSIQTWMPAMDHGGPTTPTVTETDGGLYQVTNCVLTMLGVWQLRTTLADSPGDAAPDNAIIQFQID